MVMALLMWHGVGKQQVVLLKHQHMQVTVAASKLVIGGHSQVAVNMREGSTYTFDTSDSSVSGHNFKFATAADAAGSTEYTTGVTEYWYARKCWSQDSNSCC